MLVSIAPEVDTGATVVLAGFLENGLHGGEEFGRVVLLGDAKIAGKVVRANEDAIHLRRGKQVVQRVDAGLAFDVDDQNVVGIALIDVGVDFGGSVFAIQPLTQALALERARRCLARRHPPWTQRGKGQAT